MAAIARAVGLPEHRLAVQDPFGIAVAVAALGEVRHLAAAVGLDEDDVRVLPAPDVDVGREEPAAVGRPLEVLVTVGVGVVILAVEDGAHLLRLQVQDAQRGAVLKESQLLAVGRELGLERGDVADNQRLFLQLLGVGEVFVFLADETGLVDAPRLASFGGVD